LSHRRQSSPPNSKPKQKEPPKSSDVSNDVTDQANQPQQKAFSRPKTDNTGDNEDNTQEKGDGDWGHMAPKQHSMSDLLNLESHDIRDKLQITTQKDTLYRQSIQSRKSHHLSKKTTNSKGNSSNQVTSKTSVNPDAESKKVNWVSSLIANAGQWPLKQLKFYQAKNTQTTLHLVLIDTSASTLRNDLFSQAKAVILKIAEQAYLSREQLSIIGFGNQTVETLLPRQRAPKALKNLLDTIPAAGGTPFRESLRTCRKIPKTTV